MNNFLSKNAAILIAMLGLLITIMVQWDAISKRLSKMFGAFDRVPFVIFKLLAMSFSGTLVASVFWITIDFLTLGKLSLNIVLIDLASGAAWGIPLAVLGGSLSKSSGGAVISSVFISCILLVLFGPKKVINPPGTSLSLMQIYSIVLFLLALTIGAASGFAGFATKSFIDSLPSKAQKTGAKELKSP